jgi:Fur family ferric uptake transcriptional regulator
MTKNAPSLPCGRPLHAEGEENKIDVSALEQKLVDHLASKGLKSSEQRSKIARVVLGWPGHFRIQEIAKKVQSDHAEIGPATVYRAVNLFVEAGLLRETLIRDGGESVYEVTDGGHHDHIVCLDCDRIFEFHDEAIEEQQDKLTARMGFAAEKHRHVIYARCSYKL